jgi:hypothetical protein
VVIQEALEARHYMRFCHVDVIAFGYARRTVSHKPGKCELVHAALGTTGAKSVTPAVELKGLQSSFADRFLMGVLNRG